MERKSQEPKKTDVGTYGNQTKRLNSLHDKLVQLSKHNYCHFMLFSLHENNKQFSCSVKLFGPLMMKYASSRSGKVLTGTFFDFCDNEQGTYYCVV